MTAVPGQVLVSAAVLQLAWIALVLLSPLRSSVWLAIALLVGSSVVYLITSAFLLKVSQSNKSNLFNQIPLFLVVAGVCFRLTAWQLEAEFSDDLYRYKWEARLQAAGGNPYRVAPNDPAWAHLKDATFERIPGRDFRAVYGPLTEMIYHRVALPSGHWKAPAALADLGVMGALWLLLPALGLGRERLLLYAWNPLPIFEFWGNGHNDSLMLFPLVLAFWAEARGRRMAAFALLALAAGAKIWPLALAPLLGVGLEMLVIVPVLGALMAPYGWGPLDNGALLSGFLGGWRNNDSLYGLLLWLAGGDVYAAKYAAFGLVGAAIGWAWWRRMPPVAGALFTIAAMLLISSNCHPWYLTWLLPFLAVYPVRGLLVWVALSPLFYSVLPRWFEASEWNGSTWVRWLVYAPVLTILLCEFAGALWYSKKSLHRVLTPASLQQPSAE